MNPTLRRWMPSSLRGRITAVYLVALVVTLTGFGVVGSLLFVSDLRAGNTDEVTARVGDLAAAVRSGDVTPVEQDPYAQVIDGTRVAARSSAAPPQPVLDGAELAEARQDKLVVRKSVPGLGDDAVLVATPLPDGQVIVAGASLETVNAAARRLITGLILGLPVLLLLLTLGVRHLLGSTLRPVAGLTAEAQEISTADPGRRLPVPPGDDEITALAGTLNGMLDRISAAAQRERTFLDAAAHELRTPVAALRAELELGLSSPGDDQARQALQGALREADRLGRLTADMLTLARARAGQLPLERLPTDVTDRVRATARRVTGAYPLQLNVVGEDLVADLDQVRLDQVVTNLVANAAQAGARHVTVGVRGEPGKIVITVDDDGPGFPAAMVPVRFPDPSSADLPPVPRHDSTGTGLGLIIVDMIARAHNGSVTAGNTSPLGGAHIEVRLSESALPLPR